MSLGEFKLVKGVSGDIKNNVFCSLQCSDDSEARCSAETAQSLEEID